MQQPCQRQCRQGCADIRVQIGQQMIGADTTQPGQQRTGLQDHQADTEGEPQGEQIAGAEDTLVYGDCNVGTVGTRLNARGWNL